jgi:hypothetical protein
VKRFLFPLACIFSSFVLQAQSIWDGGGSDGLWNTPANWTGDIVPGATDNVVLDNSAVSGSYTVMLPAGAVTVTIISLAITPASNAIITLILPGNNTANPGLTVTGTDDALVLNAGAIVKNSSGASAGTGISISNIFRINNGGKYIHNTARGNAAIVSQLSTVSGTALGQFEFDVPVSSYTPSLSNRVFGSLTFSGVANGAPVTYLGNGTNPVNVRGDLKINTNTTLSLSMSGDFIIAGNYDQELLSTFNIQSSNHNNFVKIAGNIASQGTITESNTGLPVLELMGSTNQLVNIHAGGAILNSIQFSINNPAGCTLVNSLSLPFKLALSMGKITTGLSQLLTLADNATYSGGSATSFVNGPLKKIGDEDFIYPVGAGNIYTPVELKAGAGQTAADAFIIEYRRSNPQSSFGTNYENLAPPNNIDHISNVEYWTIDRITGSSSKYITLPVNCESFAKNLSTLFVARYEPSPIPIWRNAGISSSTSIPASCTPFVKGTITSNEVFAFVLSNPFTIATSEPFNGNPLPIDLISFAVCRTTNSILLKWELTTPGSADLEFEVQRSNDTSSFSTFSRISGSAFKRLYEAIDPGPLVKRIIYYRLKIVDKGRLLKYSRIIALAADQPETLTTSINPNPVTGNAVLTISSSRNGNLGVVIYDMFGRIARQWSDLNLQGDRKITINISDLPGGVYQVLVFSISTSKTTRFVKL